MSLGNLRRELIETAVSLVPALLVIILAQALFLRLPAFEFAQVLVGFGLTVVGFVLFIQGAKVGLLPLGQGIGSAFIERRALVPLLGFGLALGVVLTVAEPDVRLLVFQIEQVFGDRVRGAVLIGTAAIGLGTFGVLALLRIAYGWSTARLLTPGYLAILAAAAFADELTVVQAFDVGAVTTGPMTVPFLIALGVGIASVLGGRGRMGSGFGLMAIGSLGPVLLVLLLGIARGAP